jgi:hypothetical protein
MEKQPRVSPDTQLGPWAEYLNAYTTLIKERGYSPVSVQAQVQLITRFSEWLRRGHTEVHALDEIIVERFLRRHQSAGSNSGHKMDTIGGKRVVRDRQVLEKMVSAVGIEPTTYCSTVHELKSMVSATFRQLD